MRIERGKKRTISLCRLYIIYPFPESLLCLKKPFSSPKFRKTGCNNVICNNTWHVCTNLTIRLSNNWYKPIHIFLITIFWRKEEQLWWWWLYRGVNKRRTFNWLSHKSPDVRIQIWFQHPDSTSHQILSVLFSPPLRYKSKSAHKQQNRISSYLAEYGSVKQNILVHLIWWIQQCLGRRRKRRGGDNWGKVKSNWTK